MSTNTTLTIMADSTDYIPANTLSKASFVGLVQVGGGLIQRQHAARHAERLGQGKTDDDASQHLE